MTRDPLVDEKDKDPTSEVDISNFNKSVRDVIEDLESEHEVYGDETVKKATLKCLKHLQDKRELSHKELKMSIYLDFLDNPTVDLKRESGRDIKGPPKEDLWKMGKAGLDHLEKNTDLVECTIDKKDKRYKWNAPRAKMTSVEEVNSENKSLNDFNKQHFVETGNQLQRNVNSEEEGKKRNIRVEKGKKLPYQRKKPEKGLELSLKTMEEEGRGYILSSINPEEIKKRYDVSDDSISFHWLTVLEGKNKFNPSDLHFMGHSMIDFLEENNGPIFMEGAEIILKHNSFDRFWGFLNHIVDVVSEENGILVLSLEPRTLSDQQLAQISRKLKLL